MAPFAWTARDKTGRTVSGSLDAASKEAVVSHLKASGLAVLEVTAKAGHDGPVDFAARLESHSAGPVDFSTRLTPRAPRRQVGLPIAVAIVFGGIGAALLRAAGWPPDVVPAIVAAVLLLLSAVIALAVIAGFILPARAAASFEALKQRAEDGRRNR